MWPCRANRKAHGLAADMSPHFQALAAKSGDEFMSELRHLLLLVFAEGQRTASTLAKMATEDLHFDTKLPSSGPVSGWSDEEVNTYLGEMGFGEMAGGDRDSA